MINSVYPLAIACPPIGGDHAGSWPCAGVARAFARAVESGRLNLPLPGGGQTRKRWAVLAQLGEEDLSLARLAEGHTDAVAILAELGAVTPPPGSRWGVWAAQPGHPLVRRQRREDFQPRVRPVHHGHGHGAVRSSRS